MKTLMKYADELEKQLDKLEMARYILTPKVCPTCKKLIVDHDSLIMMYHENECPLCSHVRSDN